MSVTVPLPAMGMSARAVMVFAMGVAVGAVIVDLCVAMAARSAGPVPVLVHGLRISRLVGADQTPTRLPL